jgi:hypothetical protein
MTLVEKINSVVEEGLRARLQILFTNILLDTARYKLNSSACIDTHDAMLDNNNNKLLSRLLLKHKTDIIIDISVSSDEKDVTNQLACRLCIRRTTVSVTLKINGVTTKSYWKYFVGSNTQNAICRSVQF